MAQSWVVPGTPSPLVGTHDTSLFQPSVNQNQQNIPLELVRSQFSPHLPLFFRWLTSQSPQVMSAVMGLLYNPVFSAAALGYLAATWAGLQQMKAQIDVFRQRIPQYPFFWDAWWNAWHGSWQVDWAGKREKSWKFDQKTWRIDMNWPWVTSSWGFVADVTHEIGEKWWKTENMESWWTKIRWKLDIDQRTMGIYSWFK